MTASDTLIAPVLAAYLEALVPARPPEMVAMEADAAAEDFPIIGPVCGQLCYQLARMMRTRSVFELGSGFGYSTAWFARAVQENGGGVVHHVVWDQALSDRARAHLAALGYAGLIRYHVAEAVATLAAMPEHFDLIFCDIDKESYPAALPVIKDRLRPGGVLIIDNMLWHGRIFDEGDRAESTDGVRRFTQSITADADWIVSLTPIRDGLIIAYKT